MKKEEQVVHLFVEQFNNGYSIIEKEDGAEMFAEVVEGEQEDMEKRLGKAVLQDVRCMMDAELVSKAEIVCTIKVEAREK